MLLIRPAILMACVIAAAFDLSVAPIVSASENTNHSQVRQPDWSGPGDVQQAPDPRSATLPVPKYLPLGVADPAELARQKQNAADALARMTAKPATKKPSPRPLMPLSAGVGIAATDESSCCRPSDSTGAAGPNNYVEMVNLRVQAFTKTLTPIGSAVNLANWANIHNRNVAVSDPQIEWDQQGGRWFYVVVGAQAGGSYLLYGWSKTSDPTNFSSGWCQFDFSTGDDVEDYPKLGHDTTGVVIGANIDDYPSTFLNPGPFITATIFEFAKPAAGVTSCNQPTFHQFGTRSKHLKNADNTDAFTPVPANTTDSGANDYIVAAHSPTRPGFSPKVMVWHIAYSRSGSPTLVTDVDLAVPTFQVPASAPQPNSSNYLDTIDTRLTQAVAHVDPDSANNEAVWTQHTVGESSVLPTVVWYEIVPATQTLRQSGDTLVDSSTSTFNGAISPTIDGNEAVLSFNESSSSQLTSIVQESRLGTTPLGQFDRLTAATVTVSSAPEDDNSCGGTPTSPCRWGDYAAATPDPASRHTVFMTNAVTGPRTTYFLQSGAGWVTFNLSSSTLTVPTCKTNVIAGGYYHSLVVGSDGTVWAFGADNYGQDGNGVTVQNEPTPAQVHGQFGIGILTGISSVAAGQYHSVAVKSSDGSVWTWGNNTDGELGNNDPSHANQNTPVQVVMDGTGGQPLTGISVVASRNSHTLALRKSDGSVWAWGLNTSGQLGNAGFSNGYDAIQVKGVGGFGLLTGIVAIAAGDNFSVAIDSAGNVYAWGDDTNGQLGDNRFGTGVNSPWVIQVHGLNNVGTLFGALGVASRANGSDAINSDHTVSAWGTGNQPQGIYPQLVLGNGGLNTVNPIVSIGAGFNTTLVVDNNHELWDWGDNTYGQLGDNTNTFRPNAVPVYGIGGVGYLTSAVQATGGLNHSLAVLSDGTVASWGLNDSGQLGDNTQTTRTTPVQVGMPVAAQPVVC